MLIRTLLVGLVSAVCLVAAYVAFLPIEKPAETPRAAVFVTDPAAPGPPAADLATSLGDPASFELRSGPEAQATVLKAPSIRIVTPDTMTAPQVAGALAPAEPAAEPAPATPPPAARQELLFNPLVVSASTIKAKDREIHLAGVSAPAADKSCGEGADAWPCGAMARAALRLFVHGRAITCSVPAGATDIPDPAECTVGSVNLSEWLVARGWAERSGDAFADAEKTARDGKLGIWSPSRPDHTEDVATSG